LKGSKVSINTARNIIHSCKIQVEGDQDWQSLKLVCKVLIHGPHAGTCL
jgi:hypothetical protein